MTTHATALETYRDLGRVDQALDDLLAIFDCKAN